MGSDEASRTRIGSADRGAGRAPRRGPARHRPLDRGAGRGLDRLGEGGVALRAPAVGKFSTCPPPPSPTPGRGPHRPRPGQGAGQAMSAPAPRFRDDLTEALTWPEPIARWPHPALGAPVTGPAEVDTASPEDRPPGRESFPATPRRFAPLSPPRPPRSRSARRMQAVMDAVLRCEGEAEACARRSAGQPEHGPRRRGLARAAGAAGQRDPRRHRPGARRRRASLGHPRRRQAAQSRLGLVVARTPWRTRR